ncbi:hypothetical protein RUND412_000502 [Rhizina undulata]
MAPSSPRKQGHARTHSTEVYDSARLELLVPHSSDLDISSAIAAFTGETDNKEYSIPAVSEIEQRKYLFYDEILPVFVVLQILVPLDEALYETYLSRLAVSLEVVAIDGQKRQTEYGKPLEAVHMLFQTVIDEKENPRISVHDEKRKIAVWRLNVPLGHPRARLNNPRIVLTASAAIRPAELQKPVLDNEYITSRQPFGVNLLESFTDDPYITTANPRLSAHRVSRVIPVTQAPQQAIRPLGYASKKGFNIYPAINIRLRYSRIVSGTKQTIIASLDLEVTPFGDCAVSIENVSISVSGGSATPITNDISTALPVECRPKDDITFLYRLSQTDTETPSPTATPTPIPTIRPISVTLHATALISDTCRPQIRTNWTTTVDFSTGSAPFAPPHGSLQRAHRPPSLGSIIHGATSTSTSHGGIRPVYQPVSSPGIMYTPPPTQTTFPTESQTGLTITFSGPSRVRVGEVFTWTVFVVNRSQRTRKLALVIPPRRKRVEKALPGILENGVEPVRSDEDVWAIHRGLGLEAVELVPLVNDVRVGPLLPSACHTAELRFVALVVGVLTLEGVRVVDLVSNETTECRELPSIVALDARRSDGS